MPTYLINRNKDEKGYNEVHDYVCNRLPEPPNRHPLGTFSDAKAAVAYAKINGFPKADGCFYCCEEAHSGK